MCDHETGPGVVARRIITTEDRHGGFGHHDVTGRHNADECLDHESDRLGPIVFGSAAYLQAPFTTDKDTWLTLLEETEIAMAGASTAMGDAMGLAISAFENSETDNRVLIVLTDGNDTGSRVPPVDAARVADARDVKIYTVAIGDPETIGEDAMEIIL